MVDFYGKLVGKYTVRPMDPSWDQWNPELQPFLYFNSEGFSPLDGGCVIPLSGSKIQWHPKNLTTTVDGWNPKQPREMYKTL